ncbi:MAG TPA: hypothetical protein ENN80_07520 [Candidatus Hydrogenedentes bacterium]|nr:hypothetical protein [Candidatus Hydrogenedentota bacterium]
MTGKKVAKPSQAVLKEVRSLKGHEGDVAVIEPESGRYFVDKNLTVAMRQARKAFPGKVFYCLRLGPPHTHAGVSGGRFRKPGEQAKRSQRPRRVEKSL